MKVVVNGRDLDVPDGSTLATLVEQLGLSGRPVAIEQNRRVVPRAQHAATALADGDRLEVVSLVGGG